MTESEAHLALQAVRRAAQEHDTTELKFTSRLGGAALLCVWAGAQLTEQFASLRDIREMSRRRGR